MRRSIARPRWDRSPSSACAADREAFDAVQALKAASLRPYQPAPGAEYPRSPFGAALREIAQLVKADVGLQVAFADVGGWDTHVNQGASGGQLAGRLDDFARALAARSSDLDDRLGDVVIVTMSESGRTVRQNGNAGRTTGTATRCSSSAGRCAAAAWSAGGPASAPSRCTEGRDLAVTTDFRDVFAELAERHLGVADAGKVFPGYGIDRGRFAGLLG